MTTKPIPKSIRAHGMTYEVALRESVNKDDDAWGTTRFGDQKITIAESLTEEHRWQTLLHELMHVAIRGSGYSQKEWTQDEEERFVRSVSMNLFAILRENKLLTMETV